MGGLLFFIFMTQISKIEQISGSIILETLIINIEFSATM